VRRTSPIAGVPLATRDAAQSGCFPSKQLPIELQAANVLPTPVGQGRRTLNATAPPGDFNNTSAKLSVQAFWFPVCLICRLVGPFSPEIARYVLEELLCKKIEGCD
jgi:hypothetical protein